MKATHDHVRAQLQIQGRVQGVFFRASTVSQAQGFGVTGWVMNAADGSVIAVAEGPRDAIEKLIKWCRQGPSGALVDKVDVEWQAPTNEFQGFRIKR